MALLNSAKARGLACPVCGSPDRACGGHGHAGTDPVPVDAPYYAKGTPRTGSAKVKARAVVNGMPTIFITTPEKAEANGWEVIAADTPDVADAKRPAVSARNEKRSPSKTKTARKPRPEPAGE